MQNARHIEWSDRSVAVPVFLTVALMPFTYSITAGVGAGVTSFAAIKAAQGKFRAVGAFMWVLTGVFVVYFALSPIESWIGAEQNRKPARSRTRSAPVPSRHPSPHP